MKVLVTGSTGFVASHLLPALASTHEVFALGHDGSRIPAGDWQPLVVDLRDFDSADLPAVDAVVHLAQANVPFPDGALDLHAVNTGATVRLLDHARRCGATRFVFASSASVYGFGDRPWTEDDEPAATDFYSATKLAAERFVGAYGPFLGTTVMRLVAPYGPGQQNRMIPRIVDSVRSGRPVRLNEGGRPRMNPVFVDDVVEIVGRAIDQDGLGTLNVAGPDEVTIREIAEEAGRAVGLDPVFEDGGGTVPGDIVCAAERMRRLLRRPLVPFAEGVERVARA